MFSELVFVVVVLPHTPSQVRFKSLPAFDQKLLVVWLNLYTNAILAYCTWHFFFFLLRFTLWLLVSIERKWRELCFSAVFTPFFLRFSMFTGWRIHLGNELIYYLHIFLPGIPKWFFGYWEWWENCGPRMQNVTDGLKYGEKYINMSLFLCSLNLKYLNNRYIFIFHFTYKINDVNLFKSIRLQYL